MGGQIRQFRPQNVLACSAGMAGIGQPGQFGIQFLDLCGQLLPICFHLPGHGLMPFQGGFRLGAVLFSGSDLFPQGSGALLVALDVVFQHGDAAV